MSKPVILFLALVLSSPWVGCKGDKGGTGEETVTKAAGTGGSTVAGDEAGHPRGEGPAPRAAGRPRIVFERTEYDFGEVEAGEKVEHLFSFRNAGDAPLRIERVRSA